MTKNLPFTQRCSFNTKRLTIKSIKSLLGDTLSKHQLTIKVRQLLTPKVTSPLPDDWQNIDSNDKAQQWWQQQLKESSFLAVQLNTNNELIGFLFLYETSPTAPTNEPSQQDVHIGYLLGESYWAKGFGSELIKGLVDWAQQDKPIRALIGGVDIDNIGSIKILETNGFVCAPHENAGEDNQASDVIFFEYVLS